MISAALLALVIVRALLPAIGVLFLQWDAPRVLIACFADTIFGLGILIAAATVSGGRIGFGKGAPTRPRSLAGAIAGSAVFTAILAIPLGGPLIFVLAPSGFSVPMTYYDPSFRGAIARQAAAAALWGATFLWQARRSTLEEMGVKTLFALTLLRWVVVIVVTYTGLAVLFGPYAPHFLVVVYAGAMLVSELNPRLFLRLMPGGVK